jgi:hypothetical protein
VSRFCFHISYNSQFFTAREKVDVGQGNWAIETGMGSLGQAIERTCCHNLEIRDKSLKAVQDLEAKLNIAMRWLPGSFEWQDAAKLVRVRTYQRNLDKLQGLIVAWIFKLTKINQAQTGKLS